MKYILHLKIKLCTGMKNYENLPILLSRIRKNCQKKKTVVIRGVCKGKKCRQIFIYLFDILRFFYNLIELRKKFVNFMIFHALQ